MSKWKCDICNSEFNNYHAQGFNNKIYCPLCYYKHEYNDLKQQLSQLQQEKEELIKYCERLKKELKKYPKENPVELLNTHINIILRKLKESDMSE